MFVWLIPVLAIKRLSYGIFMTISALLQGITISICKHGIFKGTPRPIEYLHGIDFYQVPGLNLHHWNSFPSGHTATAMGIASALMIIFYKDRILKNTFLLTGLLMYLIQHFYIEVLVGSLLGICCTKAAREITLRYFPKKYSVNPCSNQKSQSSGSGNSSSKSWQGRQWPDQHNFLISKGSLSTENFIVRLWK